MNIYNQNRRRPSQRVRQAVAIFFARMSGRPYIFDGPTVTEKQPTWRRWWRR